LVGEGIEAGAGFGTGADEGVGVPSLSDRLLALASLGAAVAAALGDVDSFFFAPPAFFPPTAAVFGLLVVLLLLLLPASSLSGLPIRLRSLSVRPPDETVGLLDPGRVGRDEAGILREDSMMARISIERASQASGAIEKWLVVEVGKESGLGDEEGEEESDDGREETEPREEGFVDAERVARLGFDDFSSCDEQKNRKIRQSGTVPSYGSTES
jgi:hypothetical protein